MIDLKQRALEAARESFEQSFGPDHAWTQDDVSRFAAAMLEFADAVMAEDDAEIAKLREQVEALRECREKWESCVSIEPPCHEDIEAAEAADDKARACGALEK